MYEAEKEAIDRKYYDKAKAERDKQVKETIDGYKKIAEEQKRAREAAISEAERNLQQNIQIIRKLQQEEAKGGDYVARTKDYADKMYKQRLGIKDADISALSRYGNTLITDIANARDRVLGGFGGTAPQQNATTNNNNVTVNFDNTIVENDQALVNLANKVAGLILPVVENAVGGTATANNF